MRDEVARGGDLARLHEKKTWQGTELLESGPKTTGFITSQRLLNWIQYLKAMRVVERPSGTSCFSQFWTNFSLSKYQFVAFVS